MLGIEGAVEFQVRVVQAEGDEGSNGGRGEVGWKEVRVQLEGSMAVVVARRMSQELYS